MRTIGIEIEMVGKTRRSVATAIHKVIGGSGPNLNVDAEDETITYELIKGASGGTWKVEDDDSLSGPEEFRAEVVSPILTEKEIGILKAIIHELEEIGAQADDTCGVHVHIGAPNATVEDICRLIEVMIEEEPKLVKDFNCNPVRIASFCRLMTQEFIDAFRANRPKDFSELEFLWYGEPVEDSMKRDRYHPSRYRGLNLQAYFFRFAVEFRYFDSKINPDIIEAYVRRCVDIANQAALP